MPCGNQATFDGTEVFIECDGEWNCCQREQAKAKCDNYNKNLPLKPNPGTLSSSTVKAKSEWCKDEWTDMQKDMNADKKAGAKKWATSPCLEAQLEENWEKDSTRTELKINLDHQVEVKWSGPTTPPLKALDAKVNQTFGNKAKELANEMKGSDITAVYLICPNAPPCKAPPDPQDFSTAPPGKANKKDLPATGYRTPIERKVVV